MGELKGAKQGERVLRELRKQWLQGCGQGRVILAISGGVDSMVLLEGMSRITGDRGRLLVAHVNHGLRGEESDGDEALVKAAALRLGLEFRSTTLEWRSVTPNQARCRLARDSFFRSLATKEGDRVWLAHHLNDQAETLFFRLLRGTGAKGLKGMLPRTAFKVRPFLALEKDVLLAAAREWGVEWREDRTNQDPNAYERNWIRSFFPLLEKRRPGFQRKLAALAEEARGWKLETTIPSFSPGKGIELCRPGSVPATAALSQKFSLSRLHASLLQELLRKPSGHLDAPGGARFTWSAGILLREQGASLAMALEERGSELFGPLGSWTIPKGVRLLDRGSRGESLKKELQALRVPRFFRAGVPVLERGGRPVALLPGRLRGELAKDIRFAPSELGSWWLRL
ncbi:MAG: tRNA lysidine(34) synthetase TilS [Bdellovibrionota bacterium]